MVVFTYYLCIIKSQENISFSKENFKLLLDQIQDLSAQNKKLSTQIQQQFSHISALERERN